MKQQMQHTAEELRKIADLLDCLNGSGVVSDGELHIYWTDVQMGIIQLDEPTESDSWVYTPCRKGEA